MSLLLSNMYSWSYKQTHSGTCYKNGFKVCMQKYNYIKVFQGLSSEQSPFTSKIMHPIQSPHLFFVLEESVNALPSSFLVNYSSNFLPQRKLTENRIACLTFRYFRILYTYIFVEKMKIVKERNACLHGTLEKGFAVEN